MQKSILDSPILKQAKDNQWMSKREEKKLGSVPVSFILMDENHDVFSGLYSIAITALASVVESYFFDRKFRFSV